MKKEKGKQYAEYRKQTDGRPNCWHVYNDIYEMNFYLVVGQKEKVRHTWPFTEKYLNTGFCFLNSEGNVVIWIKKKGELDTFAHELIHAISNVCREIGVKYSEDNDEHIAYLMSWLFRVFYQAVK